MTFTALKKRLSKETKKKMEQMQKCQKHQDPVLKDREKKRKKESVIYYCDVKLNCQHCLSLQCHVVLQKS